MTFTVFLAASHALQLQAATWRMQRLGYWTNRKGDAECKSGATSKDIWFLTMNPMDLPDILFPGLKVWAVFHDTKADTWLTSNQMAEKGDSNPQDIWFPLSFLCWETSYGKLSMDQWRQIWMLNSFFYFGFCTSGKCCTNFELSWILLILESVWLWSKFELSLPYV